MREPLRGSPREQTCAHHQHARTRTGAWLDSLKPARGGLRMCARARTRTPTRMAPHSSTRTATRGAARAVREQTNRTELRGTRTPQSGSGRPLAEPLRNASHQLVCLGRFEVSERRATILAGGPVMKYAFQSRRRRRIREQMPQWERPPGGMRFRPAQSPKHPHRSTSWDAVTSRRRPTRATHPVPPDSQWSG